MTLPELPAIPSAVVEGVGSEVVVCVGILLAGLILVAAWLSTYVPQDMRPIAVFVFENFDRARTAVTGVTDNRHTEPAVEPPAQQLQLQQQQPSAESNADAARTEEAAAEAVNNQQPTDSQQQELPSAAATSQRPNLAAYDVDLLDSDGDIDPEIRERVEDVLHEYTQVMEAKSDTELRNRRLKYFNCLIAGDQSNEASAAPEVSVATASTSTAAAVAEQCSTDQEQVVRAEQTTDSSQAECTVGDNAAEVADAVGSEFRPEGSLLLRLKYFNDELRTVFASPSESIENFKRRHFQTELSRNMNIRLIYNGRELKEGTDRTLASYAIPEEATIHCLVTERTEESPAQEDGSSQQEGQGDIGNYMFPLFGGILGLIWYCRICYKAYFNFMSTMALGAVTLLFFAAFFASWSSRPLRQSGPIHVHRINLDTAESRQNGRSPS